MKKNLIAIILLTLFACNEEAEIIPDNVLSQEKMVSVMVDVQLVEAALSVDKLKGDEAKEAAANYYNSVLKQHNLSKEEFDVSFKYYAEHPVFMAQIYDAMLNELSKRQAEVENEKRNEKRRKKRSEKRRKNRIKKAE